jgi:rod shape-determining protein MreC
MQKRNTFIFLFILLLFLSIFMIFIFSRYTDTLVVGNITRGFSPVRSTLFSFFQGSGAQKDEASELAFLRKELRDRKKQDAELRALRDQFDTQAVPSHSLTPAAIIGMSGYVPGVSLPDGIIIDKGSAEGMKKGQVVIYKDNVIGRVEKITPHAAKVMLIYDEQSTVNAKTVKTNALGLVEGQGQGVMQLSGVVLSEKLEKGDQVVTKGEMETGSTGYPPDLVIGKIVSIDKKASNLFQTAQVESLIPIQKLTMVFVMTRR